MVHSCIEGYLGKQRYCGYSDIPNNQNIPRYISLDCCAEQDRRTDQKKMNEVTEFKMAVNSTFSSILNEIQLSNLNFSMQMTPFAAYITLKKSTQKDQNGISAIPSPPVLFLLQDAHREINSLKEENARLKDASEVLKLESEKLTHKVGTMIEAINESNKALDASKTLNSNLLEKLEKVEKEVD